jgi:hypothetical protein
MTKLKLKTHFKAYYTDWRFWYKVFFAVWSSCMVLYSILYGWIHIDETMLQTKDAAGKVASEKPLYGVYDETGALIGYNYWEYFIYTFTFFTCQSNILVMIWFITAAIFHTKEGETGILKANFSIAVAVYITMTCLIAMVYMLPLALIVASISDGASAAANPMGGTGVVDQANGGMAIFMQLSLHLFIPIGTVIYVTLFLRKAKIMTTKQYMQQMWWRIALYPICYSVMVLISGSLLNAAGAPYILQYPYFFFYVWQNGQPQPAGISRWPLDGIPIPGYAWTIISLIIMFSIVLGFSVCYNYASIMQKLDKEKRSAYKKMDYTKKAELIYELNHHQKEESLA